MPPMKAALLLLPVLLLLAFAVYAAAFGWGIGGKVGVGPHGYFALAVGITGTLVMTGVLVGLMLYSRRKGYDGDHPPGSDG